ncbi:MAG: hypothetical protein A2252_02770 [Elusimicrobia bacterium RIFOXYA2_FULL_39_19]|nr:MAG: hypothetical protein A2252_02770 [Elusimicrobia bacterium RIFOXYA2_FULL_39_19]
MRTARLNKMFDAITVLDSVNYIKTSGDLRKMFETAHKHLRSGGVFLVFIEKLPKTIKQNQTDYFSHTIGSKEITVIENLYDADTNDNVYEEWFVYIIHETGKTNIYKEKHVCGVFKPEVWKDLAEKTGFTADFIKVKSKAFPQNHPYYMLVNVKK